MDESFNSQLNELNAKISHFKKLKTNYSKLTPTTDYNLLRNLAEKEISNLTRKRNAILKEKHNSRKPLNRLVSKNVIIAQNNEVAERKLINFDASAFSDNMFAINAHGGDSTMTAEKSFRLLPGETIVMLCIEGCVQGPPFWHIYAKTTINPFSVHSGNMTYKNDYIESVKTNQGREMCVYTNEEIPNVSLGLNDYNKPKALMGVFKLPLQLDPWTPHFINIGFDPSIKIISPTYHINSTTTTTLADIVREIRGITHGTGFTIFVHACRYNPSAINRTGNRSYKRYMIRNGRIALRTYYSNNSSNLTNSMRVRENYQASDVRKLKLTPEYSEYVEIMDEFDLLSKVDNYNEKSRKVIKLMYEDFIYIADRANASSILRHYFDIDDKKNMFKYFLIFKIYFESKIRMNYINSVVKNNRANAVNEIKIGMLIEFNKQVEKIWKFNHSFTLNKLYLFYRYIIHKKYDLSTIDDNKLFKIIGIINFLDAIYKIIKPFGKKYNLKKLLKLAGKLKNIGIIPENYYDVDTGEVFAIDFKPPTQQLIISMGDRN